MSQGLQERIASRSAIIGVVGLGYVGLPLIRAFATSGFSTIGFDVDNKKIDQLLLGKSYIKHFSSDWIQGSIESKKLIPTSNMKMMGEADVIIICVPTPLTASRDPDLRFVETTANHIAVTLRRDQLIVLESTTYPGTTRDVVLPILAEKGLKVGTDFFLAFSPEREDPGNPSFTTTTIPKVVGANDPVSLELASSLYASVVSQVVKVSSCELAEASKILENTYRAVNIALVNELKKLFIEMGIDIWEVIDAAKTKPFGFQAFYPGPGLGGHCIPIDPFYLSWVARKYKMPTRFIELAGEINSNMPEFVIERLTMALNSHSKPIRGSKICVVGLAYKPNVDDTRESPSFELMKLLLDRGAIISYHDSYLPRLPSKREYNLPAMQNTELTEEFLANQDCVLISTNHACCDYDFIVQHAPLIVDTRNATKDVTSGREKICKA